jgi:hypothetical protein
LSDAFTLYASTSRSMPGKIHASYSMHEDGISVFLFVKAT